MRLWSVRVRTGRRVHVVPLAAARLCHPDGLHDHRHDRRQRARRHVRLQVPQPQEAGVLHVWSGLVTHTHTHVQYLRAFHVNGRRRKRDMHQIAPFPRSGVLPLYGVARHRRHPCGLTRDER